jgi:hypothetical protein
MAFVQTYIPISRLAFGLLEIMGHSILVIDILEAIIAFQSEPIQLWFILI